MNVWILLALAIAFEVAGTVLLKLSDGFQNWKIGMVAMFCYWVCFWFLAPVLKVIPVGVAYAIWSGAGIALVTLIGLVVLDQKLSPAQMGFMALVFVGAIGLNLTTNPNIGV